MMPLTPPTQTQPLVPARESIGRCFQEFCREQTDEFRIDLFAGKLGQMLPGSEVVLLYRGTMSPELSFSDSQEASQQRFWRVSAAGGDYLLPRPVNANRFFDGLDAFEVSAGPPPSPAVLVYCRPAVVVAYGERWELMERGFLSSKEPAFRRSEPEQPGIRSVQAAPEVSADPTLPPSHGPGLENFPASGPTPVAGPRHFERESPPTNGEPDGAQEPTGKESSGAADPSAGNFDAGPTIHKLNRSTLDSHFENASKIEEDLAAKFKLFCEVGPGPSVQSADLESHLQLPGSLLIGSDVFSATWTPKAARSVENTDSPTAEFWAVCHPAFSWRAPPSTKTGDNVPSVILTIVFLVPAFTDKSRFTGSIVDAFEIQSRVPTPRELGEFIPAIALGPRDSPLPRKWEVVIHGKIGLRNEPPHPPPPFNPKKLTEELGKRFTDFCKVAKPFSWGGVRIAVFRQLFKELSQWFARFCLDAKALLRVEIRLMVFARFFVNLCVWLIGIPRCLWKLGRRLAKLCHDVIWPSRSDVRRLALLQFLKKWSNDIDIVSVFFPVQGGSVLFEEYSEPACEYWLVILGPSAEGLYLLPTLGDDGMTFSGLSNAGVFEVVGGERFAVSLKTIRPCLIAKNHAHDTQYDIKEKGVISF